MKLIQAITVGAGGVTSITLSSIPNTYDDLLLFYNGANTAGITFNNDTGTNYSQQTLRGSGASVSATSNSGVAFLQIGLQADASDMVNSRVYMPEYKGSAAKTTSVDTIGARNVTSTVFQATIAGRWSNTAAINSIKIDWFASTYPQNTTVYLYGITKGSGGATV